MLGLSVMFPVLPFYVRWLGLTELEAGALMGSYALASVVASPGWGRFSDRYGRRLAMVIGLAGFATAFLFFGLGSTFAELLWARVLGGLLAAAAMPAILSYAADVTPPDRRSASMGLIGAAFGLGVVAGPVVGGLLATFGLRVPFFVTAAIGFAAMFAVLIWLPESLTEDIREAALRRRNTLRGSGLTTRRIAAGLSPFLVYSFLVQTGRMGLESTLGFLVADRFGGGTTSVAMLLTGVAGMAVLVQGGGIRLLSKVFPDHSLMVSGTVLLAIGLAGLGLADAWWSLIATAMVLGIGAALLTPTFLAELSRAGASVQGEAQGLNASAQSLGRAVGPLVFTSLYVGLGTRLPYLIAAGVVLLSLTVTRGGLRSSLAQAEEAPETV